MPILPRIVRDRTGWSHANVIIPFLGGRSGISNSALPLLMFVSVDPLTGEIFTFALFGMVLRADNYSNHLFSCLIELYKAS